MQSPPQLPPPPFSTPARHASFEDLLNVSYWLWRLNPSATVPAMLGSALDVVRQSAVLLVFMATISSLASEGILGQLAESLKGGDPFALLRAITSPQLLPAVMLAVAASVALFYLISIVGGGFQLGRIWLIPSAPAHR